MGIDWGEETVNEVNKPPSEVECDGDWKKNDTIYCNKHSQSKRLVLV